MTQCVSTFLENVASRWAFDTWGNLTTAISATGNAVNWSNSAFTSYFMNTVGSLTPGVKAVVLLRATEQAGVSTALAGTTIASQVNSIAGSIVSYAYALRSFAVFGVEAATITGFAAEAAAGILVGSLAQAFYEEYQQGGSPNFDCNDPNDPNNPDNPDSPRNPDNPNYNPNYPNGDYNPTAPYNPNLPYDPTKPYGPTNPYNPASPPDPNNVWDPRNPHVPGWQPSRNPLTPPRRDPLVLDLDGDGLDLVGLHDSQAHFDLDANGFRERTGWLGGSDGFLVDDANENDLVDGVGELFGNANEDGFVALARIDSNNDGVIDSLDAEFSKLRIWNDLNGDGVTQTGELRTLTGAGVTSINVGSTASGANVSGNVVGRVGSFSVTGGGAGTIASAYFAVDTTTSYWTGSGNVTLSSLKRSGDAMKRSGDAIHISRCSGAAWLGREQTQDQPTSGRARSVGDFPFPLRHVEIWCAIPVGELVLSGDAIGLVGWWMLKRVQHDGLEVPVGDSLGDVAIVVEIRPCLLAAL